MRVLVTGGAGFIGSNLVHKLAKIDGIKIEVVDDYSSGNVTSLAGLKLRRVGAYDISQLFIHENLSDKVVVIESCISDYNLLRRISTGAYDVVFHLAANPRVQYSIEHPQTTTYINSCLSLSIIEAVKNSPKTRIVFSSTCAVYGDTHSLPTNESQVKNPLSPYGLQKSFVEDYASMAAKLHNIDIVCLRYYNVYGPRQYPGSAYSTAITAWNECVLNGRQLRSDGDGKQSRDMVYVDDVCNANILAATRKERFKGERINIGSGVSYSNNEILELFKKKFGNIKIVNAPERLGDVKHTLADISYAKKELGYEPQTSFEDGLKATWEWWAKEFKENEEGLHTDIFS